MTNLSFESLSIKEVGHGEKDLIDIKIVTIDIKIDIKIVTTN